MPLMQWPHQQNHNDTHHANYNNWPLFDNVTNSMTRINIMKMNQKPVHYMMKSATMKSNAPKRHSGHKSVAQPRRKRKRLNETNQSKDNRIVKNFLAVEKTTVSSFVLNEDRRPDLRSNRTLVSELTIDETTVKSDMDTQPKKYPSVKTSTPESIKTTDDPHLDLSSTSLTTKSVFHKTNSNGTTALTVIPDEGAFRIELTTAVTRKRSSGLDRNERSANLSHITGTARKIQLLIKNRLLQLMPDGSVNGTQDDGSDYSKLYFFIKIFYNNLFKSSTV